MMDMQSTQDREASAHETARVICECVNNLLTDIDLVASQLQNKSVTPSQSQHVLQFLHHCVDAFPECYVTRPPNEYTNAANTEEQRKHNLSKDFTTWILSRLLCILGSPKCLLLHMKSVSVVTSILKLVKTKDLSFFRKLIIDVISLYSDLLDLAEKYFDDDDDEEIFRSPLSFNQFQDRLVSNIDHDLMPQKLIKIHDYTNIQHLLKSLSQILQENCTSIQQFLTDFKIKVFSLAIRTVQISDVNLVMVSLKLLKSSVSASNMLPSHLLLEYVVILTAVLEYMIEDTNYLKDWLPIVNKSLQMVINLKTTPEDIKKLVLKKLLMMTKKKEELSVDFAQMMLELVSAILEKSSCLQSGDVDMILQLCIDNIDKKVTIKSCHVIKQCLKQQVSNPCCSFKELLKEKYSPIHRSLLKSKSNQLVWLKVVEITNLLKFCACCFDSKDMQGLFNEHDLIKLTDHMVSTLIGLISSKNTASQRCTEITMQSLDYFLIVCKCCMLADVRLPDELLHKFLEISSIPWLQSIDPPWFDFKPVAFVETLLLKLHSRLKKSFTVDVIGKSLKLLSVVGENFNCNTWISHIFRNALGSPMLGTQIKALKVFPIFLSSTGSECYSLITEEISSLARSGSNEIQAAVGSMLKDLICLVSGNAQLTMFEGKLRLNCSFCTNGKRNSAKDNVELSSIFKSFFQLYKSKTSVELKIHVMSLLKDLFSHMTEEQSMSPSSMSIWQSSLELLKDPEFKIRFNFSSSLAEFMKSFQNVAMQQLAIDSLSDIFSKASQINDVDVMETIVLSMGNVGRCSKGDLLSVMVVSLFNCFLTQNKFIAAVASDQMHQIAKAKKITCQKLFIDHKNQLSDMSAKKLLKILQDGKDIHCVTESFFDVAKLFEFHDVKAFLVAAATEMLPKIVQNASPHASIILRLFAKYLQQNRREMMFYNFKYIFSYLVRTISNETELEACVQFLQDETDVDLSSLLLSECQSVFNQLILYLSVNREQVFQGFSILASNDTSYQGPKDFRSDVDMAVFLHRKLLGILAFFNSVLTNSPNYEKKIALKSIMSLLNIMGPKYLTPVRLKVMAILKLSLRFKDDFPMLCCSAWDCFVRNIDVNYLGGLLGQIFATLLPLLDTCGEQVAAIFTFLVIDNRTTMVPYFKDIYFIPDHAALSKVKKLILSSQVVIKNIRDFKLQISSVIKGIRNENEGVQKFALVKICNLLEDNSMFLEELLVNKDAVAPCIKELINTVLHSCRKRNNDIFDLVGKCLGLLGAIDPSRIENVFEGDDINDTNVNVDVSDLNFAYEVIEELCRSFLAASNTRAQDCAAFALQEILQYYRCSDQSSQPGYALWLKFSEPTQELLYPHLHSKYVNSTSYNWSKHALPIYGSVKGNTYKEWVCTWTNYMIYILEDESGRVFQPCMSIIKHDLRMALFLLPHVVLKIIISGSVECVLQDVMTILQSSSGPNISEFTKSCTQTVFSVLDSLNGWSRRARFVNNSDSSDSPIVVAGVSRVTSFLEKIPKRLLASSSFHCGALSRSLLYFEQHIKQENSAVQDHLEFLLKIYHELDEADGISGIAATRSKPTTLHEQIIEHESSGNLRDAVACYERAIQTDPDNVNHHKGFLNCLIRLGQLNNALMDATGVVDKRPDWCPELQPYQAEIAWRLGQWDTLEGVVKQENIRSDWSLSLGQLLLFVKDGEDEKFGRTLSCIRSVQTQSLLSASLESGGYQRAYSAIIRLHMLADLERFSKIRFGHATNRENILTLFDHRVDLMESSFKSREALLNLRRVLLTFLPEKDLLQTDKDNGWLKTAKIARKDGLFQTAYSSLLNVNENNQADILIEKAKWFACQKDLHNALLNVQKGLPTLQRNEERNTYFAAKISLLKATWMEETEYYEVQPVLAQYKDAVELYNDWEKGHFRLAKYYEKLMKVCEEEGRKSGRDDFIRFVIKHYGMSLQYGSKYIYQSMPKLLTLWLDFGYETYRIIDGNVKQSEKSKRREKLQKLNEEIVRLSLVLPPYQFLTAFSQLVSRICHPESNVWKILKGIICKIFCIYKQQAIWSMVAVCKSSIITRSERCKQIFQEVCAERPALKMFINNSMELTEQLLAVCNRKVPNRENRLSMNRDFPTLVRLLNSPKFSDIMLPLQATLTVQLPSCPDPQKQHNPFAENLPLIIGVDDVIDVLSSLQKPKKIRMKASNGMSYTLMCKPKDDLRKDNRLMEFNSLVNKFLLRDSDCRRRQLHIRTYSVIPLNEECGLLEWVPNTSGLRYILNKIYKDKGLVVKVPELKQMYEQMRNAPLHVKVDIFLNRILPRFPAVFQEWFLDTFSNPTQWYMARLSYCRTAAVMSMVGYTLGLGDRHGENILFDSVSGDCVHVDFNCLFNKGETFDCPEKVPFRLTNNMIHAMGPLGYEGIFRKSCEMTMEVMRQQRDSFLSVLNTFLYDPLVEWKKESRKKGCESSNEMALKILKNVENRLKGYIHSAIHLPLSIEGQVHQLIKESTNVENLAQMYIGWAPYM